MFCVYDEFGELIAVTPDAAAVSAILKSERAVKAVKMKPEEIAIVATSDGFHQETAPAHIERIRSGMRKSA